MSGNTCNDCHQLEASAAELKARLRTTAQILIEQIGAPGPEGADTTATRAVGVIRTLEARVAELESDVDSLRKSNRRMFSDLTAHPQLVSQIQERLDASEARVAELEALINTPHTGEFLEAVRLEAAHQRERWSEQDASKSPTDWLWTFGYLVNKAVHDVRGKRAHHIVAGAALLLNWHRQIEGEES